MTKQEVFIKQAGSPVQDDRATIVIMGNYQEYDADQTHIRHAFDYLQPPEAKPHMATQRVNPGKPVEVNLGMCEPGKCEVILAHNKPKVSSDDSGLLAKAQQNNKIIITNADGAELAWILPNRATLVHFPGKIFAHTTSATALLHVTAFPA